MAAAAAGERVGFEARDPCLVEPCAKSLTGRRRAKEGRDRGLKESVEGCEADVECRLHADSLALMQTGHRLGGSEGWLAKPATSLLPRERTTLRCFVVRSRCPP